MKYRQIQFVRIT